MHNIIFKQGGKHRVAYPNLLGKKDLMLLLLGEAQGPSIYLS
jgi:hypothetical protein